MPIGRGQPTCQSGRHGSVRTQCKSARRGEKEKEVSKLSTGRKTVEMDRKGRGYEEEPGGGRRYQEKKERRREEEKERRRERRRRRGEAGPGGLVGWLEVPEVEGCSVVATGNQPTNQPPELPRSDYR